MLVASVMAGVALMNAFVRRVSFVRMGQVTFVKPLPTNRQRTLDPTHPLLMYHVAARAALLTQGSATIALGWLAPSSLTARLLVDGGVFGEAVLLAMSAIVCVGWLDVVINDVLPERFKLTWIRTHEHLGYMVLGVAYWSQAMGGAATELAGATVLLLNYLAVGAVCCWYGWTSAMHGGRDRGGRHG